MHVSFVIYVEFDWFGKGLWGFQGCFFMQIILTAVRTLKMSLESGFYGISHNCVPFIYFYALQRGKHIVAALSVRYLVRQITLKTTIGF